MVELAQATIDQINASLGGPAVATPGGAIPASAGVPTVGGERRDPAGNVVVPPSAPATAPGPADTAPAAVAFKFKQGSGVHSDHMDPRLVERANRLYDLMPENVRKDTEIISARRSEAQQVAAYDRFMRGVGGLAARPGHSQHEIGAAFDVNQGTALWLQTAEGKKALDAVGLSAPFGGKGDPNHVQLSEAGARGDAVADAKGRDQRALDPDKITAINAALADKGPTTTSTEGGLAAALGAGLVAESEEAGRFVEHSKPFLAGMAYGVAEMPAGAAQAVTPAGTLAPIEQKMKELSSQFQDNEENSAAFMIGRITSTTAAILATSGAFGAAKIGALMPRVATAVSEGVGKVGMAGRTILTGMGFGATQFYADPEKEERPFDAPPRAFDATVGGLIGGIGLTVLKGVSFAANQLAKTSFGGQFLPVLAQTAKGMTTASEAPMNDALDRYTQVTRIKNARYSLRDATGREFEGFPSGVGDGADPGFAQAIAEFLPKAQKGAVRRAAEEVREVLGLSGEETRKAAADKAAEAYQKQIAAHPELKHAGPSYLRQMEDKIGPPPEVFQARPVAAESYSEARKRLNEHIRTTRSSDARRLMLKMKRQVDEVAAASAGKGVSQEEFIRKAEAASEWIRNNHAPLKEFFGNKSVGEVEAEQRGGSLSQLTPAKFNDKVVHIIEKGDLKEAELLGAMLGKKGRENMVQLTAARALEKVQDGAVKPAYKYIKEHEEVLRQMLGRDEFAQLMGVGKIADEIADRFVKKKGESIMKGVWDYSHSFAPVFAFYRAFEGHYKEAAVLLLALPAFHLASHVAREIHTVPIVKPLVRRAAGMKPGSKELDDLIKVIERRVRITTAVAARGAVQEQAGSP